MRTVEDLVRTEVHYCVSSLVSTLAAAWNVDYVNPDMDALHEQAQELSYPIDDWEEAARQGGWTYSPVCWTRPKKDSDPNPDDGVPMACSDAQQACEIDELDAYQWDVFEHWIVSNWLAEQLAAHGEKVDTDFAGLTVWARTTTGQSIAMDAVIQAIHAELMKG